MPAHIWLQDMDRICFYTRRLMRERRMLEFVIPYIETKNGVLAYMELMPIELNLDKKEVWQKDNPRFSKQHRIFVKYEKRVSKISNLHRIILI